jgi:hypothetical protein
MERYKNINQDGPRSMTYSREKLMGTARNKSLNKVVTRNIGCILVFLQVRSMERTLMPNELK